MKRIRIVYIGAGNFSANTIYPTLRLIENTPEIAAVCELDEQRAKSVMERFGIKTYYRDYIEMITKEDPDAVFVVGGPKLHYEVLKKIIPLKIPIYAEKPTAPTAKQAKELAELAAEHGTHVQVGFMHRFAPVSEWAKNIIKTKEFGRLCMMSLKNIIWGTNYSTLVLDSGIHSLDLIRMYAGDVKSVSAVSTSDGDRRHGFLVTVKFQNGCICMLNLNSFNNFVNPGDEVELYGSGGEWIRCGNWDEGIWYRHFDQYMGAPQDPYDSNGYFRQSWTAAAINRSTVTQGYMGEIEAFLKCVAENTSPVPDLTDGWRAVELAEAISKASETGETVQISE
jgi:myo-inositol 2-dehydrogenase / D-chiro-inositol 1-dehydrogenase